MSGVATIALREFRAFFQLPLGWIIVALCLLGSGFAFTNATLIPGQPASMRDFFAFWWFILAIIAPSISMRLFSEELRSGTFEPLMSSPVSEFSIVLGKYFGALLLLAACLTPTLIYVGVLGALTRPDYGPIFAGYLGVLLAGALYLAVGLVFSALTSSQTLAFLATMFVLIGVELVIAYGSSQLPPQAARAVGELSANARIADFAKGVVDTANIAYFVVVSAWLVGISAVILRARRWR
ncbi:MAG: ABC transporter permease [Phycisphaerales bacterium]|nr:ABC transporter permease [Phycisphaerales bacterium]